MNAIQAFKEYLESHLDEIKERAPERKKEINDLYAQITLEYEQALTASLASKDEIARLTAQVDKIRQDLQQAMDQNDDIAGIIDKAAAGVAVITKIAGTLIKA